VTHISTTAPFPERLAAPRLGFWIKETAGLPRRDEPVSVGVPLPDGWADLRALTIVDENGHRNECQWDTLSYWPSGSPRWVLATSLISLGAHQELHYEVVRQSVVEPPQVQHHVWDRLAIAERPDTILSVPARDKAGSLGIDVRLEVVSGKGKVHAPRSCVTTAISSGPVCETHLVEGCLKKRRPIRFAVHITRFCAIPLLRIEVTLHNPRRAEHAGGFWDLGDPQSEWLRSATLHIETALPASRTVFWREGPEDTLKQTEEQNWSLIQRSSGGTNWRSRAHRDASGEVPLRLCGYEVLNGNRRTTGKRASPLVGLQNNTSGITVGMEDFWQKFPSGIEIDHSTLRVHLFPSSPDGVHELQAGEKTTRTIWIRLTPGRDAISDLGWIYCPLVAAPTADAFADSGSLEWHVPADSDQRQVGRQLTGELLEGHRNFFVKRELVDEYGWRNYGDFWADHEEAFAEQPKPIISHYNNQYDLLHGLLRQYLSTGDGRWWQLAAPLARHLLDIDIYHTAEDRAAYNGGLFWHTSHYLDAGGCTHRSYSRDMTGQKQRVFGGGPSNEHNYTTGLLLYYHLTGDRRAREAVLSLADWVIAMDDGCRHVLAPFSSARTGTASSTGSTDYHGPGRGVGNSINALIDAWQVTQRSVYLDKCRELIRRVAHPAEDVASLTLNNAELRWSYTVCLQALARYDEIVGHADRETCQYIQACLLNYGRWMLEQETLYLDDPGQLEFPTETWAAQDLRKGTCLMLIARYARGDEAERMVQRGEDILRVAWAQLMEFESRCCTRPGALVLQQLPFERYLRSAAGAASRGLPTAELAKIAWPPRPVFRSQKEQIRADVRTPAGMCRLAFRAMRPRPWTNFLPHTPLGAWFRRLTR